MKNVLFVGVDESGAVSRIMKETLKRLHLDDAQLFTFGLGTENKIVQEEGIVSYYKRIPIFPHRIIFKLQREMLSLIGRNNHLVSWRLIYKNLEKLCDRIKPDIIIAMSGLFYYMKAAFECSKKRNIKLSLVFFDPYETNALIHDKVSAIKEANLWCEYARTIIFDKDGEKPLSNTFDNKMSSFLIPIFEKETVSNNNSIIYGGFFYKGFRSSQTLLTFLNTVQDNSVHFDLYINRNDKKAIKRHVPKNTSIHSLQPVEKYEEICKQCLAIIVIGNGHQHNVKPSKFLEAIGHKKPIILINFPDDIGHFSKYPFSYKSDRDVVAKIKHLNREKLLKYNIYSDFPERNPDLFIEKIISLINV